MSHPSNSTASWIALFAAPSAISRCGSSIKLRNSSLAYWGSKARAQRLSFSSAGCSQQILSNDSRSKTFLIRTPILAPRDTEHWTQPRTWLTFRWPKNASPHWRRKPWIRYQNQLTRINLSSSTEMVLWIACLRLVAPSAFRLENQLWRTVQQTKRSFLYVRYQDKSRLGARVSWAEQHL